MRFVIVGAGGIGAYFGGELARAGHEVTLFARGAHLDALRTRGLTVRTPEGEFVARVGATNDPSELPAADVAIVAVKSYSLPDVTPIVRVVAERGADVVPLLNGVTAADELKAGGVPPSRVLGGLARVSVVRTEPGVVERRSGFYSIVVGELGGGLSERATKIADALRSAGVDARASATMGVELCRSSCSSPPWPPCVGWLVRRSVRCEQLQVGVASSNVPSRKSLMSLALVAYHSLMTKRLAPPRTSIRSPLR